MVDANTSAAYSQYAASHAGTSRARTAATRAEELAWEEAVASNQSVAFFSYVSAWPKGEHAAEAQTRAETLGWSEALADGTIPALSAYLARYPSSPHRAEAESRVEDLVYGEAKAKPSEASLGRYLVQYPEGRYTTELKAQLEALVWEKTVAGDTRAAYQRYLDRYHDGPHAEQAVQWLDATYVTSIEPVFMLISTWQPDWVAVLRRLSKEFARGLGADLSREYKLLKTQGVDAREKQPHPHDLFAPEKGVGLLVVEYRDKRGRTFDPAGNATDITAVVKLYAPNTRTPILVRELSSTTPDKILGTEVSALYTSALDDLMGQLRTLEPELVKNKPEEM